MRPPRRGTPILREGAVRRIHAALVESANMARCKAAFEGLPQHLTLADQIILASQIMAHALLALTPEQRVEMLTGFFSLTHETLDRTATGTPPQ
jgi:hypothetical protein